jgi:hypothetical protein
MLFLPWVLDIGTVAFLLVTPRLLREWWDTSGFTRECLLVGESGNQAVTLSLHRTHAYLLRKNWQRQPGELGINSFSETGTFNRTGDQITLRAHHGLIREIKRTGQNVYLVEEPHPASEDYSLKGWVLREVPNARESSRRTQLE